jgi:hypothetical protein
MAKEDVLWATESIFSAALFKALRKNDDETS